MKDLFRNRQEVIASRQDSCSEKNCENCFANSGCMYDELLQVAALAQAVEQSSRETANIDNDASLIGKRA